MASNKVSENFTVESPAGISLSSGNILPHLVFQGISGFQDDQSSLPRFDWWQTHRTMPQLCSLPTSHNDVLCTWKAFTPSPLHSLIHSRLTPSRKTSPISTALIGSLLFYSFEYFSVVLLITPFGSYSHFLSDNILLFNTITYMTQEGLNIPGYNYSWVTSGRASPDRQRYLKFCHYN